MSEPLIPPSMSPDEAQPTRPVLRPIPRWVVMVGVPVMVLIAVVAVWLLLGFGLDRDRLDAIRTGGTLGVGLGGAVVLWLAVRRQRSTELDLLQKYEAHKLAELTAQHTREDAVERRITDLYTKAVEQLGSEKAPVRLGGLYALERLAQNNSSQQQTIVNVICAYLRMPYAVPGKQLPEDVDDTARATHEQRAQEREVRLAAQRILAAHLCPDPNSDHPNKTIWVDMNLDLTGATLIDFVLKDCRINDCWFDGTKFVGQAVFIGTDFTGEALFLNADFTGDALFYDAKFAGHAWFNGAKFAGKTSFCDAKFSGDADFNGAKYAGKADFRDAEFTGEVRFSGAEFTRDTGFRDVTLGMPLEFARFHGSDSSASANEEV